jgi:hypothetical protein
VGGGGGLLVDLLFFKFVLMLEGVGRRVAHWGEYGAFGVPCGRADPGIGILRLGKNFFIFFC